jgi:hypothetical protein
MITRSESRFLEERMYGLAECRRLTEGVCPVCEANQETVLAMCHDVYDLVYDKPRQAKVNVGPFLGSQYIVYKISELLGHRYIMDGVFISSDFGEKNKMWKEVCAFLEWTYIH